MRLRVICKAQEQMKKSANKHCREVTFDKGDQLYLKLQSYRFHSLASCLNEKLSPRFYGPFTIMERIRQVAYKLKLLE